jgi:predicted unusual protein kinase regulating ubiquinone biosynthesis (AarF/ABC1/UbiB family)
VPSFSFKSLPEQGFLRVTQGSLAKAIVDEASQGMILDEYLDPDRHSGNILQAKRLGLPWALGPVKPVWIDLGQSVPIPLETVKPILRAGLALKYGRSEEAARALAEIFAFGPGQSRAELEALLRPELSVKRKDQTETLIAAIMKAEKERYLVRADYAALEKALLMLNGYAPQLPANYIMDSMEKAVFLRVLRERPRAAWSLAWARLRELFGADRHDEFLAAIESLGRA